MDPQSFSNIALVSCGTLTMELNHLRESGFLNVRHIFFTTPGLHESPRELERQLVQRIQKAKDMAEHPEEFLEYSDWMGIPVQPYAIGLDRLKSLLSAQAALL